MIKQIRIDFSSVYPQDIINALIDSFIDIRENYYLEKHEPAELNGGKFVEAFVRLLQYELTGSYTPIGQPVRNMARELRNFEQTPAHHHDSFRLHIPRVLLSIYNIRNRRGVGHLGGDVNPNLSDSTLIVAAANWGLAELYRIHYTVSLDEAQQIINDLVERKVALVHDLDNIKRVLDPKLTAKDQTLILLYSTHPDALSEKELLQFIEYSNSSNYRNKILRYLHRQRLINYGDDKNCILLPPGLKYVENNYNNWLERLNQRD